LVYELQCIQYGRSLTDQTMWVGKKYHNNSTSPDKASKNQPNKAWLTRLEMCGGHTQPPHQM